MPGAPGAKAENHDGQRQLDNGKQRQVPTAEHQCFHCFGLVDPAQELTRSQVAHFLGVEPEDSAQETLLEQRPGADEEPPLEPEGPELQQDRGEQE